jgi:O-antigen ligase
VRDGGEGVTHAISGFGGARIAADFTVSRPSVSTGKQANPPAGIALLRPVYGVAAATAAGVALYFGGIAGTTITIAALIALWAFAEPRTAMWLATAFMVFLFVFFQSTAPLGEELPAEFLFWGIGVALITTGLMTATLFSSVVNWSLARKRLGASASLAMAAMAIVILAATVYGLATGNQFFAVARQLFGCLLLPGFYFLAIVLFRSADDVAVWLRRLSWVVALGSLWYVERLSLISFARGTYYREQSPLVAYSGAIAVVAWMQLLVQRKLSSRLQALAQFVMCVMATLLMGNRAALGSAAIAILLLTGMVLWRKRVLLMAIVMCLVPIGVGIAPYVMTGLLENRDLPGMIAGRFIFVLSEDQSYQGRVAQMEVVMNMVSQRPILGAGMGSENTFIMPGEHRLKVASVDNGWGYILLKMGYAGLVVFLALIGLLARCGLSGLQSPATEAGQAERLAVVGVFFYALVSFLGGPTFFHFSVAPFFAAFLGALVTLRSAPKIAKPIHEGAVAEPLRGMGEFEREGEQCLG